MFFNFNCYNKCLQKVASTLVASSCCSKDPEPSIMEVLLKKINNLLYIFIFKGKSK